MAKFEDAIPVILRHEGGYVNDPADPGGATNYGISIRFLQREGLEYDLDNDGDVDMDDMRLFPIEEAKQLYQDYFWKPLRCDEINDQTIATKHFDMGVNMGLKRAIRILQTACNNLGSKLMVDGLTGPNTLRETNHWEPRFLLKELQLEQRVFYKMLASVYPTRAKFLPNWLKRAAWPAQ